MRDPVTIITDDHRKVEALFERYNTIGDGNAEEKKECSDKILKELAIHAKMEEKFFYPAIREAAGENHPAMIAEAKAEHHSAKIIMMELKLLPVEDEKHAARMKVLEEQIKHHVQEEESEMLPFASEALTPGQMEDLGKKMDDYKMEKQKSLLDKLFDALNGDDD